MFDVPKATKERLDRCPNAEYLGIRIQIRIAYFNNRAKTDMKSRLVLTKTTRAAPWTSPQPSMPQKVNRVRSNSTSMTSPPVTTRKRTSSGVFQVDNSEPLPKKSEVSPSLPENPRARTEPIPNGRKKSNIEESGKREQESVVKKKDLLEKKKEKVEKTKQSVEKKKEKVEKIKESVDKKKDKIIDKFDSKAKSNCVSAFKESDSWD